MMRKKTLIIVFLGILSFDFRAQDGLSGSKSHSGRKSQIIEAVDSSENINTVCIGKFYKNGVSLLSPLTINSGSWTDVNEMSFSFVAQSTSALVIFSSSGYGFTESMANIQFRVMNNGVSIGGTNEGITSNVGQTEIPWSCDFTKFISGLTVGTTYTFKVQSQKSAVSENANIRIDPTINSHHMSLSVVQ